ncbi:hypothetical protein S83_046991, partial [Arachis hypogaea]
RDSDQYNAYSYRSRSRCSAWPNSFHNLWTILNVPFATVIQKSQSQFMLAQDERLRSTLEILNSMKIIKLQSWEEKFKSLVELLRTKKFIWLSKTQIMKGYESILYWIAPTIIFAVVFLRCVLFHSAPLDVGTIFTILATLRIIMSQLVRMILEALSILIQVMVSFDRLNNFFLVEELGNNKIVRSVKQISIGDNIAIEIEGRNFTWDQRSVSPTILIVYLIILLEITYSLTKPMDKKRYQNTIKACALDKDINDFSHGDLTEIGQRKINMSGGQKQMIQLARE